MYVALQERLEGRTFLPGAFLQVARPRGKWVCGC